jgi:AraC-like DNA-binding protein
LAAPENFLFPTLSNTRDRSGRPHGAVAFHRRNSKPFVAHGAGAINSFDLGGIGTRRAIRPHRFSYSKANGPDRHWRTHPAIAHVAMHFARKIALDDVAALCQLSPTQFCRVFRQEQGVSFCQYLLRYRLERACEGLAHSGALAKEVAYAVGFNDLSYFTWAFKRQLGLTPSEYRAGARLS